MFFSVTEVSYGKGEQGRTEDGALWHMTPEYKLMKEEAHPQYLEKGLTCGKALNKNIC